MSMFGLLIDAPHWGYLKALTPQLLEHEIHLIFVVDGPHFAPQNASKVELFLRLCAHELGHYKETERLPLQSHFLRGTSPPEHPPIGTLEYFLPLPEHLGGSADALAVELSDGQLNCLDHWTDVEISETHLRGLIGTSNTYFERPNVEVDFEALLQGKNISQAQEHFLKDLNLLRYAWPFKAGDWLSKAYHILLSSPDHQGAHLLLKLLGHSWSTSEQGGTIALLPPAPNTTCYIHWETQLPEAQLLRQYEQLNNQSSTDWVLYISHPNPSPGLQAALPEANWNQELPQTAAWVMMFDDHTRLVPDHIAQHQSFIQTSPWVGLVLNAFQTPEVQMGPLCLETGILHPLINLERALIHPLFGPGHFVRQSLWQEHCKSDDVDLACLGQVAVGYLPDVHVHYQAPQPHLKSLSQRAFTAGQALKRLGASPLSEWPALPLLEQTLKQYLKTFADTLHSGQAELSAIKETSTGVFGAYVQAHQFWKEHAQSLRPPALIGSGTSHKEEILF